MSIWMAVFSFIFGDVVPPEERFNTKRMIALASMIRSRGGSVAPIELLPFCVRNVGMLSANAGEYTAKFLDVLAHFDGSTETSHLGHVAFVFPKLMPVKRSDPPPNFVQENFWVFSYATDQQIAKVSGLGIVNLVLVLVLYILKKVLAVESVLDQRRGDLEFVTFCINFA